MTRTADQLLSDALAVLEAIGMPRAQRNERSALCLLALLGLRPGGSWDALKSPLMGITPIMDWVRDQYGKTYAPNTRETFQRQSMHQFVAAGLALYNPDNPARPVNSPNAVYQIAPAVLDLLRTYGSNKWKAMLEAYLAQGATLTQQYAKHRDMQMVPVQIAAGKTINLSPGAHSDLIRAIIEQFAPRFLPGAQLIYVGDTGDKMGYFDVDRLTQLGVVTDNHGKFPDVVFHHSQKNWLNSRRKRD